MLVKGVAAMGPMLFFSFETVSCFISQDYLDNGQCANTSRAAMCLSIYLVILTIMSFFNKSASKSVQRQIVWEKSAMATLKLKGWQRLQEGLMTISAVASVFLLSALGVEGDENLTVFRIGVLRAVSLSFAALIGAFMLIRIKKEL